MKSKQENTVHSKRENTLHSKQENTLHGNIAHGNRKERRTSRTPLIFVAELLILALLIVTASYAPQMIFQVQDSFLCERTTLGKRESMDVESLSITYEKSLVQRMKFFAEGLMSEVNYYVTSQNLTIDQEIYDYLNSEKGLQQDIIWILWEIEFVPMSLYEEFYVNEWKQYVIYSDNYAKGVNFILWYMELMDRDGSVLKLLMDAETGTLYAFKTENIDHSDKAAISREWSPANLIWMWNYFANYYEAFSQSGVEYLEEAYKLWEEPISTDEYVFPNRNTNNWWENDEAAFVFGNVGFQIKDNIIDFYLPYGETSLMLRILMDQESIKDEEWGIHLYYRYPAITIGIQQIYKMIPEFA